jgi:hypothetical protein
MYFCKKNNDKEKNSSSDEEFDEKQFKNVKDIFDSDF